MLKRWTLAGCTKQFRCLSTAAGIIDVSEGIRVKIVYLTTLILAETYSNHENPAPKSTFLPIACTTHSLTSFPRQRLRRKSLPLARPLVIICWKSIGPRGQDGMHP